MHETRYICCKKTPEGLAHVFLASPSGHLKIFYLPGQTGNPYALMEISLVLGNFIHAASLFDTGASENTTKIKIHKIIDR